MLNKVIEVSMICLLCTGMGGFSQGTTLREDTIPPEPLDSIPGTYLITTQWSQYGIYNDRCPYYFDPSEDPTVGNCRLGCWSVAIAQIIRYYELQSSGTVEYKCSLNSYPPLPIIIPSYIINHVGTHEYNWLLMPNIVTSSSSEDEQEMTNQFTFDVACVIKKDFGTGQYIDTGENYLNLRIEIMNHFPDIIAVTWKNALNTSTIQFCLNNSRPIMLYIRNTGEQRGNKSYHAVVLDGYRFTNGIFEVHLNYGWGGANNSWYAYDEPFPGYDDTTFRKALIIYANPPTQIVQLTKTGFTHTPYTFQGKTTHRNVSVAYYQFDWGDGTMSDWIGRYEPGVWCNASHSWNESGVYPVRVRASDMVQWVSNWSLSRPFYIPKNPRILPIVEWCFKLIDRFPRLGLLLIPIIERLCR